MSYCPDCAEKDKLIREQRDEIARLTEIADMEHSAAISAAGRAERAEAELARLKAESKK